MKLLELKGYKSHRALQAYSALLLGMKMLPMYMGESFEDFYERVEAMPLADQEKVIREALFFVELQKDDVECLMSFATDDNDVPYSPGYVMKMGPAQIIDVLTAVCMEFAKIKVTLVTPSEKKKSGSSQLT